MLNLKNRMKIIWKYQTEHLITYLTSINDSESPNLSQKLISRSQGSAKLLAESEM